MGLNGPKSITGLSFGFDFMGSRAFFFFRFFFFTLEQALLCPFQHSVLFGRVLACGALWQPLSKSF